MKIVSATSFFKKARSGVNAGVKRENLTWTFEAVDASDVAKLDAAEVATIINAAIESFGRKLVAANGDDWSYVPTPADVNFAATYAEMIEERKSGGRILTKDSLAKFANVYVTVMTTNGIPAKAANIVAGLIKEKFASIAGKIDVVEACANRLVQFCEFADDDVLSDVADVCDALINLLKELSTPAELSAMDL